MVNIATELQALSYREVQAKCKEHAVSAKGTKAELVGRLIQKLQDEEARESPRAAAPTPTPAAVVRRSAARGAAASQPPAPTPPPAKSIDRSVIRKALSTPLPSTPQRLTQGTAPRRRRPSSRWPFALGALVAVALALLAAAALPHCQRTDCVALAREVPPQATELARRLAAQAAAGAHSGAAAGRAAAAQAFDAASAQYQSLVRALQAPEARGAAFDGRLDPAVLEAVLPAEQAAGRWANLRATLEQEVWAGGKINERKANTVLFVCGSDEACAYGGELLAGAAPADATLALAAGELGGGGDRGALQARLAAFLQEEPRGVVVIKDVGALSPGLLSVLSNGMGEQGAFEHRGRPVPAHGATFLLTWRAPPAILAEDSEEGLALAAKETLVVALASAAAGEDGKAVAQSFRRRIDLVAPVLE